MSGTTASPPPPKQPLCTLMQPRCPAARWSCVGFSIETELIKQNMWPSKAGNEKRVDYRNNEETNRIF